MGLEALGLRAANSCVPLRTRDALSVQRRRERLQFQTSLGGRGSGETPIPSITGPAAGGKAEMNTILTPMERMVGSAERLLQYAEHAPGDIVP